MLGAGAWGMNLNINKRGKMGWTLEGMKEVGRNVKVGN